jgi:hypothetical protein
MIVPSPGWKRDFRCIPQECHSSPSIPRGTISAPIQDSPSWSAASACLRLAPWKLAPSVFATGANGAGAGHTSIYDVNTHTWTPGPDFPGNLDVADGPAELLPDGNVLVSASPGIFLNGTVFFEWDGQSLTPVPATSNSPINSSWYGRMLMLPTGQVLYRTAAPTSKSIRRPGVPIPGLRLRRSLPARLSRVAVHCAWWAFASTGRRRRMRTATMRRRPPTIPSCESRIPVQGTFSIVGHTTTARWRSDTRGQRIPR